MHEEFKAISGHICDGLFSIGKDGFGTRRMVRQLPGRHYAFEKKLPKLRNRPCTSEEESRGASIVRSVRKQLSFVVHMDAELPVWFTESV